MTSFLDLASRFGVGAIPGTRAIHIIPTDTAIIPTATTAVVTTDTGNGYYGGGYSSHSSVANLQRRLAHAGYYHGRIDGIMGPRTREALRAYRHVHGTG